MTRCVYRFGPWFAAAIAAWTAVCLGAEPGGAAKEDPAIKRFEAQFATVPWGYGWTHGIDKVLRKDRRWDQHAIARFDREMMAVGAVDHPNIVRAMDAREIEGTRLLAMEYVDGLDLVT